MVGSLIAMGTVAGAAVLGSAASSKWTGGCDLSRMIGAGMAGIGAAILLIAMVPAEIAALAGSASMGLSVAVVMLAANVMLQGETPPELRGRLSGSTASLTSLAQLAALLLAGVLAARLGIRGVFLLSAALLFATGIGAFLGGRRARVRYFRAERNRSLRRRSKCAAGNQSGPGDS
jgi:DHA3 family macrolide efflux protein-like MFS transporter